MTPPAKARVEPLRDIPGLRRKEKTWRDEVQERVRSRRNKRALAGLPLFEQVEAAEPPQPPAPQPVEPAPPLPEASAAAPAAGAAANPVVGAVEASAPPPVAQGRAEDLVTLRLSDAELGDLPLNADEAELAGRAREDAVLPRTTRRPMPSLEEDAFVDELESQPEVELPPLATEAPPLERPAFAAERAQAAAVDAILFGALAVVVLYFTGRAARAPVTALAAELAGARRVSRAAGALLRRLLHGHDGTDARQADDGPARGGRLGPAPELRPRHAARAGGDAGDRAGRLGAGSDGVRPRPPHAPRPPVPHARRPRAERAS